MNRAPNAALRRLMTEAGWGNGQLARATNRIAAESGTELHYGASTVTYWLRGVLPRPGARPAILEALSRRLGRQVTAAEAGFTADPLPQEGADTVSHLVDIGRADVDPSRRALLGASVYIAPLAVPAYGELAGRPEASRGGRTTRIGAADVATVRTMTERIADILDELGGGHARPMAAAFLVNTVGPYLRADATEPVRRSMLAAASDLVYLMGWMAMYETEHG